ncbi:hypothetical protein ACFQ8C_29270 [Streptomyces sp. NPDC056503]|uniref:hypothetical protein n=1 Tax=Streptomyces sp. NPDC056503 TaxID=3345842 RepID=UPI00368E6C2E
MIMSSVDPSSESFTDGQAVGVLLATAIALVVIWIATRTWRRGPRPTGGVTAEQATALAIRRENIVRGVLLVLAAAGLLRAFTYEGEPPAAEATPVVQEPSPQTSTTATAPSKVNRVIDAAPRVGGYRLVTGTQAAEYEQMTSGKAPSGKQWFYDGPGQGPVGAVLQINAVEWDTKLAETKHSQTTTHELRNFFAGAQATEVTAFEAGPWGGKLSCGFATSAAGRPIVCAWTDSGTWGRIMLMDEQSLSHAADIALQFRTNSEKRT